MQEKEEELAAATLLADRTDRKNPPFQLFKSAVAKSAITQQESREQRNGPGSCVRKTIYRLQRSTGCLIHGNPSAWWKADLPLSFLQHHFADRNNITKNVLLIRDNFPGHWTSEMQGYAASINVVLMRVTPTLYVRVSASGHRVDEAVEEPARSKWIESVKKQEVRHQERR